VQAYFNRPDVQAALHANRSQHALPYGPWQGCSTIVKYSQCAAGRRRMLPARVAAGR
jgi:predicted aminopeptidase